MVSRSGVPLPVPSETGPVEVGTGSNGTRAVAVPPTLTVSRRNGSHGSVGRNCSVVGVSQVQAPGLAGARVA